MLSSLLLSRSSLAASGKIDASLDAIFVSSAKATPHVDAPVNEVAALNLKDEDASKPRKRKRPDDAAEEPRHSRKRSKKEAKKITQAESTLKQDDNTSLELIKDTEEKKRRRNKSRPSEPLVEDSPSVVSNSSGSEHKVAPEETLKVAAASRSAGTDESDDNTEGEPLLHETVSGKMSEGKSIRRKTRYAPEDETSAQRDERTVFIGNLPLEVLMKKALQKALKRHLLSCMPSPPEAGTKIESIRFRSVAFKTPTNPLALKEGAKEGKPHHRERAAAWKAQRTESNLNTDGDKPKVYLKPAEKKRIAFIKGEFHDQADSVNAFVVFAHANPNRTSPPLMHPADAAALVVEKMNLSKFEGRTLRVDRVGQAADPTMKDTGTTLFVGNLDFTAKEEELRTFFETLLTTAIGPATRRSERSDESSGEDGGDPDEGEISQWVYNVRVVRDEGTQLGKGFAYVRFSDRICIDEILAMDQAKLKFAKRKLRVKRYSKSNEKERSIPEATKNLKNAEKPSRRSKKASNSIKGDPKLGERLKGMTKEERKEAKKQDAIRQARRMAKKEARLALEKSLTKPQKERVRVRRTKPMSGLGKKNKKAH